MLIDHYLPRYDVTEVHEVPVDAPPEVTYRTIRETDLTDPMINALFAIRELPTRLVRRLRGEVPHPPSAAVAPDLFVGFAEPGYAKLALSFRVLPIAGGGSLLRYEARTATTDDVARRRLRRYWRLIHPGVALVMRRALERIRAEAERREAALAGAGCAGDMWGSGASE